MYHRGVGNVHLKTCLRYPFTEARILDTIQEEIIRCNMKKEEDDESKNALSDEVRNNILKGIVLECKDTSLDLFHKVWEKQKHILNKNKREKKNIAVYQCYLQCLNVIQSLYSRISVNILEQKYSIDLHVSKCKYKQINHNNIKLILKIYCDMI